MRATSPAVNRRAVLRRLVIAGALGAGLVLPDASAQVTQDEMRELAARLPAPAAGTVDFDRDIRPIFEAACLRCHGPERPKSGFRLTSREEALKGGDYGAAIVPNESARSPLLFYSARLVEDMEMPPAGKGDPLTPEQLGLLRAWIDQGAAWSAAATNAAKIRFAATPAIQWFHVKGDERKFREHTGIKDGWGGGAQSVTIEQPLGPNRKATFEGRFLTNPEDYKLRLQVEQRDLGFARFGFEQYSEYYDDTGGFDALQTTSTYSLDQNLRLDIGRAWVDFGLTLPHWPKMTFGYEFQYRDGAKSLLQWGDVGTIEPEFNGFDTDARKIYPAVKHIDEQVHVFKFDLTHEINGVGIENNFRAELYDNDTRRETVSFLDTGGNGQNRLFSVDEGHDHFQASDSIRLEKQLRDWLFLSGGYYFSRLDGQYGLNVQPSFPTGEFPSFDRYYFTEAIVLEQNTHIFNANAQLGPWSGFSMYGGVQSEWMSQRGFGDVRLDEGFPPTQGGPVPLPAFLDSNLDRVSVEEHFGARYTAIPHTVLFAEGRLAQESIGQTEARSELGGGQFLRDTDAASHLADGRVGFTVSPWTRASLTAHYKKKVKDSDYDHLRDIDDFRSPDGYSAFITARDLSADEFSAKLSLRPLNWMKLGLTYQLIATDTDTETQEIPAGNFGETPGGWVLGANYDSHVYGLNLGLNPWHRLSFLSSFSYRQNRTSTGHNFSPVIVNYEGDVYSTISSATFIVNPKTDLTATYTYSWADYGQSNWGAGQPMGLAYDWHAVSAGITRRFKKNITTNLQYRFYQYDEENMGGGNNYTAHGVLASMTIAMD